MQILFLLIPVSIVLLGIAIWAFFWAVKNDQFEDLEGPAYSILFDDEPPAAKPDSAHHALTSEPTNSEVEPKSDKLTNLSQTINKSSQLAAKPEVAPTKHE